VGFSSRRPRANGLRRIGPGAFAMEKRRGIWPLPASPMTEPRRWLPESPGEVRSVVAAEVAGPGLQLCRRLQFEGC